MIFNDDVLGNSERLSFELCELYAGYGYSQFRMSKFEEYGLYLGNKDYLISDNIITFTDTNGKLMALKPDVTLSIIKNSGKLAGKLKKLYYKENVYRVAKGSGCFREIPQAGLECIGDVDDYCIGEVLLLAAKSLRSISPEYCLSISNLSLLTRFIDGLTEDISVRKKLMNCVDSRNAGEIETVCKEAGLPAESGAQLITLLNIYGKPDDCLDSLKAFCERNGMPDEYEAVAGVLEVIAAEPVRLNIQFDFSIVSNIRYYNGIIFRGFVNGIPESVLCGGQYDMLMSRMNQRGRAIGFAVYLDRLEYLFAGGQGRSVDAVLLYGPDEKAADIIKARNLLAIDGKSVLAVKELPQNVKYKHLAKLEKGEVKLIE